MISPRHAALRWWREENGYDASLVPRRSHAPSESLPQDSRLRTQDSRLLSNFTLKRTNINARTLWTQHAALIGGSIKIVIACIEGETSQ